MKRTLKIVSFCLICCLLLVGFRKVYFYKHYGNWSITNLYELPADSVEVLAAGDSHVLTTLNPAVIWEEQGIPCYTVSSEGQDIWLTYYRLVEALKTQNPRLIIVDVHNAVNSNEYSNDAAAVMGILGMKTSWNKFEAIRASVTPDKYMDFLLEFPTYHTRYTELVRNDFQNNYGDRYFEDMKGFKPLFYSNPPAFLNDISDVTECDDLTPKMEKYLRNIIELSEEHGIPLLLIAAPYWLIDEEEQRLYNRVDFIASEYGVEFVNFNLNIEEIGLIPEEDFADPHHLSFSGSEKFSSYLGQFIQEKYGFTDKRETPSYTSWDKNCMDYRQLAQDHELDSAEGIEEFIHLLNNPMYTVIISVRNTYQDQLIQELMESIGIDNESYHTYGVWVLQSGQVINAIPWGSSQVWQWKIGGDDLQISLGYGQTPEITFAGEDYISVLDGINVLVYNNYRECVASSAGFNKDEGYRRVNAE